MKLWDGSLELVQQLHEMGGYGERALAAKLGLLASSFCVLNHLEGIGLYLDGRLVVWANPSGTIDVLTNGDLWRDNLTTDEVLIMHHNNTL